MPLYVNGNVLEKQSEDLKSLQGFLQKYERVFEKQNEELKSQSERRVSRDMRCLYVSQREVSGLAPFDKNFSSLGTDMMTTCHVVVLHCDETKATALAHFDGCATMEGAKKMVEIVEEMSRLCDPAELAPQQVYNLHVAGGFGDDRKISEELSVELLQAFASEFSGSPQIHLRTFCVTPLNEKLIKRGSRFVKSPIVFGMAVEVKSGDIFPVVFDDDAKGPASDLRGAMSLNGPHTMNNLYDWKSGEMVIPPFAMNGFPDIEFWIRLPDHLIRQHLSTSPEVEPDNFEEHIRQSLRFISKHPDLMNSIFQGNRSLRFKKVDGGWERL